MLQFSHDLTALNCNFMLISLFLCPDCVDVKFPSAPVCRKENRRCSWDQQQNPRPYSPFTWISPVNVNLVATRSVCATRFLSCQCWFYVVVGNNPETSGRHCWSVIQRAAQPQPDPHSSQHSRSHWHDGSQLLQQPARRQCFRNITSERPRYVGFQELILHGCWLLLAGAY